MNGDSKLRLLYLAKMLFELTDEDCFLTITQMKNILEGQYGIPSHRQTIRAEIDLLKMYGMDIQEVKSTQNRYNLVSRQFDVAELKLLIDAVESAKFIPKEKSTALVRKISTLSSKNQAEKLRRNVSVVGRIKANNNKIYTIIDGINEAINHHQKILFTYFIYDENKKKVLRHNGKPYIISPLHLVWNGDYYYLIGIKDDTEQLGNFRIDRIASNPVILDIVALPAPEGFDISEYINTTFRMFSGDTSEVELICDNSTMDAIIDHFGEDVATYPLNTTSFRTVVNVSTSHIFYSWIFGFGGLVKINGPEAVKEEYRRMLQTATEAI